LGYFVENVAFSGLHLTFPGGGTQEDAQGVVPELRDRYPEYHMFGTLPAYGIYLRHVKGLTFEDITLNTVAPDMRPALVGEDVEDLELTNFRAAGTGPAALLRLSDTRQVYLHGCRPLSDVALFLSVEGAGSRDILLQSNDLRRANQVCTLAEGVSVDAIINA
jgi:hypothetical protein